MCKVSVRFCFLIETGSFSFVLCEGAVDGVIFLDNVGSSSSSDSGSVLILVSVVVPFSVAVSDGVSDVVPMEVEVEVPVSGVDFHGDNKPETLSNQDKLFLRSGFIVPL